LKPPPARSWLGHLGAALLFIGLACWQMGPVLWQLQTEAIGHPGNDVWNHIWGYAFVAESLAHGKLPIYTDLLAWPQGGSLWFIDTFNAVLTLPIQWVAGPIAAYNLSYLLNFALAGLGCYLLALSVSGSRAGALLAGIAFQTAPHMLGQAYNGISETLAIGWLPLALLGARWAVQQPSRKRGLIAGLMLGLCGVANWYYGLFAGMAIIGLMVREAYRHWWRRARPSPELLWMLLCMGAATLLIAGPPFMAFRSTMSAADAIVTRDPSFVWSTLVLHNMTDVVSLFRPGKFYSPDLKVRFGEDLIVVVYLGHALIWPALAVLMTHLRGRATSWAWLAAGFLVLTLGPFLFVGGSYVEILGGWLPLPFLGLHEAIPMFSRISHAYRFVMGTTLALCVLLALMVRAVRIQGGPVWAVVAVLTVLRVGESFYGSSAVFPLAHSSLQIPSVMADLQDGAVLDLPVAVPVLNRGQYSIGQLVHGQPIPYGLNDPIPPPIAANHFLSFLVEMEWSRAHSFPSSLPWLDLELGRQAAIDDGLKWIVLHEELYPEASFNRVSRFLDMVATPTHHTEGVRIYRLEP
jgi:hypothetical protein